MSVNLHRIDRTVRLVVAALILLAWAAGWVSGTLAIVLAVVAVTLLATSAVGFCPIYRVFGISTCAVR